MVEKRKKAAKLYPKRPRHFFYHHTSVCFTENKLKHRKFMAKQNGSFNVRGKVGNLVFYKSSKQFLVRSAPKTNKKKMKYDPAYAGVRQHNADFATAAKAGKLLRKAFASVVLLSRDSSLTARVSSYMMSIIKTDAVSELGKRSVIQGHLDLLKSFEFNKALKFHRTCCMRYEINFNRQSGKGTVMWQPYTSQVLVDAPEAATHYSLIFALAACNFGSGEYLSEMVMSDPQPLAPVQSSLTTLTTAVPGVRSEPVFVALGITFSSLVNGRYEPVGGVKGCAITIAEIDYQ
jgi:hypothetical protein